MVAWAVTKRPGSFGLLTGAIMEKRLYWHVVSMLSGFALAALLQQCFSGCGTVTTTVTNQLTTPQLVLPAQYLSPAATMAPVEEIIRAPVGPAASVVDMTSEVANCSKSGSVHPMKLVPTCMNASTLTVSPSPQSVNTAFNVSFSAKRASGKPVGVGGSVYYALLEGPALSVGTVWPHGNGDLSLEFTAPLPGVYNLTLTLLYDHYDRIWEQWEEQTAFNFNDIKDCLTSCHHVGEGLEPFGPGAKQDSYYEACMDSCREFFGGPKFRGDEKVLSGIVVNGETTYLPRDAPICGVDVEPDQEGYWVDTRTVCGPNRDPACLERIMLCPRETYSKANHMCSKRLMWRPKTCRHVLWRGDVENYQANKTLYDARARYAKAASEHSVVMCGDSTTREFSEFLAYYAPELKWTMEFTTTACHDRPGSVLFMGGCGFNAATSSIVPLSQIMPLCEKWADKLNQTDRALIIFRSFPAPHPWKVPSKHVLEHPTVKALPPYHGQRNWLTIPQIKLFNEGVKVVLRSKGIEFLFVDEFALTEPLRGFQLDALHWWAPLTAPNFSDFVLETAVNSFVASLTWAVTASQ